MKSTRNHALKIALTAESSLQPDVIHKLEATGQGIHKIEYKQLKNSLQKLIKINPKVRFAYLYTKIDGKIFFLVDSEPATSDDYSPPGQLYSEADVFIYQAMEQQEPIVTEPAKDRWGTWVSILVPIKDDTSEEIIAVFGMDYPANDWDDAAIQSTILAGFVVIFFILLYITVSLLILKNRALMDEKKKLAIVNENLTEKEELFRTIFEQSPFGIAFGNLRDNILDVNPKYEEIVGRKKNELVNQSWIDITHPDDIKEDKDKFIQFKAGEINGYTIKKRYIRPNGEIIWANMTLAPLKLEKNNYLSHLCIIEDLSDRVQAEKNLLESERSNAMLLSNLPGMAYRCDYDRQWTMHFVSEGCYELTGYRPECFIENKVIAYNDIINEDYQDYIWNKWTDAIKERKIFREEYPITTTRNEEKWVLEQGQGVYDEDGKVEAIEGLIIDITIQKKREKEILYLTYHDALTGIHNRRYFDENKVLLDKEEKYPLSVIVGDINGLKLINSAMGHQEGDKFINAIANILKSCIRKEDVLARTGGDEFSILLPNTRYEDACDIINLINSTCKEYNNHSTDDAYHISISLGCATKTNSKISLENIIKEAEQSMYRKKLLESRSLHSSLISSMKTTLCEKSHETEAHAGRLISISKSIGYKMNLMNEQLNELELLSTLHDIGKIGISDTILNKPGKLSEEEWIEMKKHPEMGYRIAMSTPELAPIADYILCHHERWDGKGYPQGLQGEEIPILSRIIAIADAFDAMTQDRPYRKAMKVEEALEEISINAGKQFDPNIVKIFLENIENIIDK
ncbi:diguanylate cyclase [Mobilitalea sibirica]|uniref:Diguanylate cyclase n=1 Tax=Mobilitalea sibirica TaxID=1462919 RepID=A0A8J7H5P8_9FIRM|nr:HD domain-containing phosphohydrolase [Mobilitalea sibirica]MBH1941759.1 diguanylate cyclase [Mobilitalea sibirica]